MAKPARVLLIMKHGLQHLDWNSIKLDTNMMEKQNIILFSVMIILNNYTINTRTY